MNFLILTGIAITAWLATKLFDFVDRVVVRVERKKRIKAYYNGQFYKKKCSKLQKKIFGYYYDFACTDPISLAHFIASREIEGIKSTKRIDFLYKQIAE